MDSLVIIVYGIPAEKKKWMDLMAILVIVLDTIWYCTCPLVYDITVIFY